MIKYQEQGDLAFQLLVKSQLMTKPISFQELMKYCLTPVPYSLGTPDGFLAKTDKAKMVHYVMSDFLENVLLPINNCLHIEDGNAFIHSLKDLPPTFGLICAKVLDMMSHKGDFVFSTDSYQPLSIKSQERLRRGYSEKLLLSGVNTRRPPDIKLFLHNDENKLQLFHMLLKVWSSGDSSEKLAGRSAILIVEGVANHLYVESGQTVNAEIHELRSNQEETDSRIILYIEYAIMNGYDSVVIRSPDSDIFFILMYYANHRKYKINVYFDTGVGKHRRIIDISKTAESLGDQYTEALLGIYIFTGEDCTSAFKGKGKVGPLKKLHKYPKFQKVFTELGVDWDVTESSLKLLESFTCIMYGHPRLNNIDEVREIMLKKMVGEDETLNSKSKVDLARLPPCKKSLHPHIRRANYRAALWKRSHIPIFEHPSATGHGWMVNDDGHMEPHWSDGPVLPPSLIDILQSGKEDGQSDSDTDDEDGMDDFEDILDNMDCLSDSDDE